MESLLEIDDEDDERGEDEDVLEPDDERDVWAVTESLLDTEDERVPPNFVTLNIDVFEGEREVRAVIETKFDTVKVFVN